MNSLAALVWVVPFLLLLPDLHVLQSTAATPPVDVYRPKFDVKSSNCDPLVKELRSNTTILKGIRSSVKFRNAVVVFLLAGILSVIIAYAFQAIRRIVYHDADNLDTTFDAGGKTSLGLTSSVLVSQLTWSMDLLYPSTTAVRFGISGPYWYGLPCCVQIVFFSVLSLQLKTRAPGAKTFLQVIMARFGKATHIIFCIFGLTANTIVTAILLTSSCAVLTSLVNGMSPEMCIILMAVVIGCYTMIGGLGATFYVGYFNTTIIFIGVLSLIAEVYYNPFGHENYIFGNLDSIYRYVSCVQTTSADNADHSYLTFRSDSWMYVFIVAFTACTGILCCDQSNWQCSVATKPAMGVYGFIIAGLTYVCVPLTIGTAMGIVYIAMTSAQGDPVLSMDSVDAGLVAPAVIQYVLGSYGEYLMIILILMAVMSTGSAELIAVASLVVYDIYQVYIQPFRPNLKEGDCPLCQKPRQSGPKDNDDNVCSCSSVKSCASCMKDNIARMECKRLVKPSYTCVLHGEFRAYQDHLKGYSDWCILWITILCIPLYLFCYWINLNLTWSFLCFGIFTSAAAFPIISSVFWARVNSKAMISGVLVALTCGITSWLAVASTYPGGLTVFFPNTSENTPVMVGNLVSFFGGGIICVIVTLITSRSLTEQEAAIEWEKTRNIDNPLFPWAEMYQEELGDQKGEKCLERSSVAEINKRYRSAKIISLGSWSFLIVLFLFVIPGILSYWSTLSRVGFSTWVTIINVFAIILGCFIILVPLIQEIVSICQGLHKNRYAHKTSSTIVLTSPVKGRS